MTEEQKWISASVLINGALYLLLVAITGLWTAHHAACYLAIATAGFVYLSGVGRLLGWLNPAASFFVSLALGVAAGLALFV